MRKWLLLLFSFCLLNSYVSAQYVWRELGVGPKALKANNTIHSLCLDSLGNLYAAGAFSDSDGYCYVAKWDGTNWKKLGPVNNPKHWTLLYGYGIEEVKVDFEGDVYAYGPACDTTSIIYNQWYWYYVSEWDGTSWDVPGHYHQPGFDGVANLSFFCLDGSGNLYAIASQYTDGHSDFMKWNDGWVIYSTSFGAAGGRANTMCTDAAGNVYAAGDFTDSHGYRFVAKWEGDTTWSELGTGNNALNANDEIQAICFDRFGNLYAAGCFSDPSVNGNKACVAKWDGTTWTRLGSNTSPLNSYHCITSICTDSIGNVYVNGAFGDTVHSQGVSKWNGVTWQQLGTSFGNPNSFGSIRSITCTKNGVVYAAGTFRNSFGQRFVAEYHELLPDEFYVSLASVDHDCVNGGAITSTIYGGTPPYKFLWNTSDTTADLNSLPVGNYSVTVFDSLGKQANAYAGVKSSCNTLINGIAFADLNSNCVYDSMDKITSGLFIWFESGNGAIYYTTTDTSGRYTISFPGEGHFLVFTGNNDNCSTVKLCNSINDSVFIPFIGDTLNNIDLAITGHKYDLTLQVASAIANPGFSKEYHITPYNLSPVSLPGQATIIFTYDSNLTYLSSEAPLPLVNTTYHTLTWVLDGANIPYSKSNRNEQLVSTFNIPASLDLNYILRNDFVIEPSIEDCNAQNNHIQFAQRVVGSVDPNEKEISPSRNYTDEDSVFTYTIHFQNTGTDSTKFVVVKDTLSDYLEPTSTVVLASSHPYSVFRISDKGTLTWIFDPLQLPDSTTDNAGSKGFVTFSVQKKRGWYTSGFSNTASIYFDYNNPVRTNTVNSKHVVVNRIEEVKEQNAITVKAFPNPFNDITHIVVSGINQKFDFELYDVTGRLQMHRASIQTNQFDIQRGQLPTGVYLYRIMRGAEAMGYGKLVIQ